MDGFVILLKILVVENAFCEESGKKLHQVSGSKWFVMISLIMLANIFTAAYYY